jgi:hypothetical protein
VLKTPYRPEATMCFQRLKDIDATYKNAIEAILKIAKEEDPFWQRLEAMVNIHIDEVEGDLRSLKKSRKEEDIYLCCLFDIVDAVFAQESEMILDSSFGAEQKRHAMDRLLRNLKDVALGGPQWNHVTVPRIQKRLEDVKKQIH